MVELYLQPPSPTISKLPSIKTMFPIISLNENEQLFGNIPIIKLTSNDIYNSNNKLRVMEPHFDSPCVSPYQSSPTLLYSSTSSTASSIANSPLILPLSENSFLLPPLDNIHNCRSLSNNPCSNPALLEPSLFSLSNSNNKEANVFSDEEAVCRERKRGRPPNSSQAKSCLSDHHPLTFIQPTVWSVKKIQPSKNSIDQKNYADNFSSISSHATSTANAIRYDIDSSLASNTNLHKKKRGRKPKKQFAGNSCFVWKDLTAPRGANKKNFHNKKKKPS